jgi:phosphoglycerate kinase
MIKFHKQTIKDVDVKGKTVLVRADYNVPLDDSGQIADDFRICSSLATLQYLQKQKCKIVIISHLGRPHGKEMKFSLAPVATRLSELLGEPVVFMNDCIGSEIRQKISDQSDSALILLENLRFYDEEKANDSQFASQLAEASTASYFIQDGFGVVHRAHASTEAITHFLPSVAGLLLEKEYSVITGAMQHPEHPLIAVLGGAKVSDKLPLLEALIPIADCVLVGGTMANTFLANQGISVGGSKYEADQSVQISRIIHAIAKKVGAGNESEFLRLPSDVVVAKEVSETADIQTVNINNIGNQDLALDIGDETVKDFTNKIASARTVIWNGTMGLAEMDHFANGSRGVAKAITSNREIVSVVGGGDTADFVLGWSSQNSKTFSHVSTGGGASLELMSGQMLPGIEALLDV